MQMLVESELHVFTLWERASRLSRPDAPNWSNRSESGQRHSSTDIAISYTMFVEYLMQKPSNLNMCTVAARTKKPCMPDIQEESANASMLLKR